MANPNKSKKFNAGALQSIIDNVGIIYNYEFIGEVSTNWVDVNPIPFETGEEQQPENVNTGGAGTVADSNSKTTPPTNKNNAQANTPKESTPTTNKPGETNTSGAGGNKEGGEETPVNDQLKQYESAWGTGGTPPIIDKYGRPGY